MTARTWTKRYFIVENYLKEEHWTILIEREETYTIRLRYKSEITIDRRNEDTA